MLCWVGQGGEWRLCGREGGRVGTIIVPTMETAVCSGARGPGVLPICWRQSLLLAT